MFVKYHALIIFDSQILNQEIYLFEIFGTPRESCDFDLRLQLPSI